jgi:hypothetical protein
MAKTLDILTHAALPRTGRGDAAGLWKSAIARRAAFFFQQQRDRDIERFIEERGGVFSDEMERAIARYLSTGRSFS